MIFHASVDDSILIITTCKALIGLRCYGKKNVMLRMGLAGKLKEVRKLKRRYGYNHVYLYTHKEFSSIKKY